MVKNRSFITLYLIFLLIFFIACPDMAKSNNNPEMTQKNVPKSANELNFKHEGLSLVIENGTFDKLYHKWFKPILPTYSTSDLYPCVYNVLHASGKF